MRAHHSGDVVVKYPSELGRQVELWQMYPAQCSAADHAALMHMGGVSPPGSVLDWEAEVMRAVALTPAKKTLKSNEGMVEKFLKSCHKIAEEALKEPGLITELSVSKKKDPTTRKISGESRSVNDNCFVPHKEDEG